MRIVKPTEVNAAYRRASGYFNTPGAIKTSTRLLKSGKSTDYFFDLDYELNDPLNCEDAVLLYTDMIQKICHRHRIDFLGFIEKATGGPRPSGGTVGAIRLSGAITIYTGIPNVPIRLAKQMLHERIKLPYDPSRTTEERLAGSIVVLVADHISTGRELLDAADSIKENGGLVTDVVAYSIRATLTSWQEFQDRQIEIHSIFRLSEESKREVAELRA